MSTLVHTHSAGDPAIATSHSGIGKVFAAAYSLVCYTAFFGTILYAIGFIGNLMVPKAIDTGAGSVSLSAISINCLLLTVFALQHSVMARPAFKKWFTRFIPAAIERSTYVLLSSLALLLLFWQWQPMSQVIWHTDNSVMFWFCTGLYFSGWAIVFLSTFMINHFELFGLKQVYQYCKEQTPTEAAFTTRYFYTFVRHPLMLGFLIALWATHSMTAGHLLFAAVTTAYIFIAVKFLEERDLRKALGAQYVAYQKRVPMIIPRIW